VMIMIIILLKLIIIVIIITIMTITIMLIIMMMMIPSRRSRRKVHCFVDCFQMNFSDLAIYHTAFLALNLTLHTWVECNEFAGIDSPRLGESSYIE
jgi:hypothetical protein